MGGDIWQFPNPLVHFPEPKPLLSLLSIHPLPAYRLLRQIMYLCRQIVRKALNQYQRPFSQAAAAVLYQESPEVAPFTYLDDLPRPDPKYAETIGSFLHLHACTDAPLNVTFIRAPSHALLKVDVPLVFRGEDVCPGLRKGSSLNTIKRTVKYLCPADIVPPYIDVDLSELDVGQKIVMGDLKVHPALKLLQSKDEPVCKIMGARASDQQRKSK
ncbi:hypothetical protein L6164_009209 [Bauhinia variegata]|uniref:Uncharacterized protein n=1 Tax=Bauhinia variegata TaxID=167791 RepID=A0ACB9PJ44_BAUVA|nr:hypothetical protein L6164_009209 [Bauhinia variegata]